MRSAVVVGIMWTLVAVTLVCFFAALLSARAERAQWSQVTPPPKAHPTCVGLGRGGWCP